MTKMLEDAAELDAARYRWLRSQERLAHASLTDDNAPYAIHIGVANDSDIWGLAGDHADQMIDEAMQESGEWTEGVG